MARCPGRSAPTPPLRTSVFFALGSATLLGLWQLAGGDLPARSAFIEGLILIALSAGVLFLTLREVQRRSAQRQATLEAELARQVSAATLITRIHDAAPDVAFAFRVDTSGHMHFPYASRRMEELVPVRIAELVDDATPALRLIHPDDALSFYQAVDLSRTHLTPFREEFRVLHPDGRILWADVNTQPERQADGSTIWFGFLRDITARRQVEEALAASEERLRLATAAANLGTWDWDMVHNTIHWSPRVWGFYGLDPASGPLTFDRIREAIDPADRENVVARMKAAVEGRAPLALEFRVRPPGGRLVWIAANGLVHRDASGRPVRMIGTQLDITDRKEAEAALRENELRYRTVFATVAEGIILQNVHGEIIAANPAAAEILGLTMDEVLGRTSRDARWRAVRADGSPFPGEEHPVSIALATGTPQLAKTMGVHRPDGTLVWLSVNARPIIGPGPDARPEGVVCSFVDISAQTRAAAFTREHMRVLEMIASGSPVSETLEALLRTVERDHDSLLTSVMLFDDQTQTLHFAAAPRLPAAYVAAVEGVPVGPEIGSCGTSVHRAEPVFTADIATDPLWKDYAHLALPHGLRACWSTPILDRERKVLGTFGIYHAEPGLPGPEERQLIEMASHTAAIAITRHQSEAALRAAYEELRETQQMLLQQERLRAFGQMASGVAHDINNAVSPIALYASLLLDSESHLSDQGREFLTIIERAAASVGDTIARLRKLYRGEDEPRTLKPFDLPPVLDEAVLLTRARWSDMAQQAGVRIELKTELAPALPAVLGIASEIRESLINLIFNAVDALPQGGTITLRARPATAEEYDGAGVAIELSDTGVGMSEEARRRCLEPFFTTKGAQGTGLGLAIVGSIVQHHRGQLQIESEPGRGTTVRLLLGAVTDPATPPALPGPDAAPAARKILVIDDDTRILRAMRLALEHEGHRPVCVETGQAGIDTFRSAQDSGAPFDAVITDLGMPQVDGSRVALAVKSMSAQTPVILLTGWGHEIQAEGDAPPGVDCLLGKPVTPEQLREALASCLR